MSIDLEKIKKQTGFQYIVNSEGVVCRLVPIDKARKQDEFLRIIKEKCVNVGAFMKCCLSLDYEEYIKQWGNWHKHIFKNISGEVLTKEEYNSIKEVLK